MRLLFLSLLLAAAPASAQRLLIPMDEGQSDHLKAYGAVYWALERGVAVEWLLNHRGGSFLADDASGLADELRVRNVAFEPLSGAGAATLVAEVERPDANTSAVRLERAPRIAVYAPEQTLPWDDAVLLALTYAEIPYEQIYDDDVLDGRLEEFDWLHLHHEDFTGQYGKFYGSYRTQAWYQQQQRDAEAAARQHGFAKVSHLKLAVAQHIRRYVLEGGFLFAMCSGTDTFDLALAAHATDIVPAEMDGDGIAPDAVSRLDFAQTFAFEGFTPSFNPMEYEHSDIDVSPPPALQNPLTDYFTLFDFSAKWDPVPTMLTQNHVASVRGFMGQTTNFREGLLKPGVVVLAESPGGEMVRYLYGPAGQGFFAFYGGHDPEDYQHFVGDPPTDLTLHPHSPGYRLILNNVLFPAAQKQPQKT
ncbi:MAG TPA: asparagine synthetase B [Rubricoccaceae bacterium]|nr:asparagine synthetase B [Rubricoccaceae bacterium]